MELELHAAFVQFLYTRVNYGICNLGEKKGKKKNNEAEIVRESISRVDFN